MQYHKVIGAAQAASLLALTSVTSGAQPAQGMEGYQVVNSSPMPFLLTDAGGQVEGVIPPWSVVYGNLSRSTQYVTLATTTDVAPQSQAGITAAEISVRLSLFPHSVSETTTSLPLPSVSLTGTLPALASVTPRLLATVPYTDFVASGNIYPYYSAVLTRSARERTFILYNTMDQALTASSLAFYDSVLGIVGQPGIARTAVFTPPGADAVTYTTSEMASNQGEGLIASHIDSFQAILGMGATLPTSGNLLIYVSELL